MPAATASTVIIGDYQTSTTYFIKTNSISNISIPMEIKLNSHERILYEKLG
jgi:hypothetical protein